MLYPSNLQLTALLSSVLCLLDSASNLKRSARQTSTDSFAVCFPRRVSVSPRPRIVLLSYALCLFLNSQLSSVLRLSTSDLSLPAANYQLPAVFPHAPCSMLHPSNLQLSAPRVHQTQMLALTYHLFAKLFLAKKASLLLFRAQNKNGATKSC
jgi:hypothetical protein